MDFAAVIFEENAGFSFFFLEHDAAAVEDFAEPVHELTRVDLQKIRSKLDFVFLQINVARFFAAFIAAPAFKVFLYLFLDFFFIHGRFHGFMPKFSFMQPTFELDRFQKEAIDWIEKGHSVLVSAPTGAGKTVIAECAIQQAMDRHENAIYTAPVKALSNQKYRDFRAQYGDDQVGILTGDVSINPDAPILVMTTEIYRNSLFENSERIQKTGWVIFDEVHYLDDPERGTVWEEALLFTPHHIRILALSATVPNVQQLADWIKKIHDRPVEVVLESHRPVPLEMVFQCQGKIMEDLKTLKRDGYLNRDSWRLTSRERHRGMPFMRSKPNRLDHMLEYLISKNRLPAIYFAFGRRRTETLAWDAAKFDFLNERERKEITEAYGELVERYDLQNEKSAQDLGGLIEQGIAYHHAGMLPTLKEVIEQLFTKKLIKLIFTTETFAIGINMPARTVVFDELEKYYGNGFRRLSYRDFYQMAGRAGRRGMDPVGYVLIRIHPEHVAYSDVERIIHGKPESIESQLNAAYATLLNLYRDLGEKLFEIYPKSFHYFQSSKLLRDKGLFNMQSKLKLLQHGGYLAAEGLTPKGEFASSIFGYELMLSELQEEGFLEKMTDMQLSVLISGLIFEPRKGDHVPHLTGNIQKIQSYAEHAHRKICKLERQMRIFPHTKHPHFHQALAVEAWMQGAEFDRLFKLTSTDEGELVRHFRMIIQLLRELKHAHNTSDTVQATARKALGKINRGVVDAERQLRV